MIVVNLKSINLQYDFNFTPLFCTHVLFQSQCDVPIYNTKCSIHKQAPIFKNEHQNCTKTQHSKYISKTNISIVMLSTGLANLSEIKEAINIFKRNINIKIVLMKCNSAYPAILKDMNLKTIGTYKKKFNVIPGLSDHSLDSLAPVVAVSYGAKVIEKHFSLSKKSIDGFFSLNKNEFKKMVSQIREVEALIGNTSYEISKDSKKNLFAKRSLYIVKDIGINEKFNPSNVKSIRPAHGISSRY